MFSKSDKSLVIAGPCALDSTEVNLQIANTIKAICQELKLSYIFKASFDKANRLSMSSPRGMGLESAKERFLEVKSTLFVPITTDVHDIHQVSAIREFIDVIQIPAFLSRQTDLIVECSRTGLIVNIKKAQFMSWHDAILAAEKAKSSGAREVWITERGNMFGYKDLIVDFRNLYELLQSEVKVIFDATHAVQRPGGGQNQSSGDRKYVPSLVAAAAAVGVKNIFFEAHPNPDESISDGPNMLKLDSVLSVLRDFTKIQAYRDSNPLADSH